MTNFNEPHTADKNKVRENLEKCNGKGTALWASEVEPFCIAVTKEHFREETT